MIGRWLSLGLVLLVPAVVRAHDGPPYPLLMDEKAGPYRLSVWADPDIGTGTFFVFVEAPEGRSTEAVEVHVRVRPKTGRLPEVSYQATRKEVGRRVQYLAEVEFDAQEQWEVRFEVSGPVGKGEVAAEVEATPPGLGRWDLALYLFPFVLVAALWVYGMVRSRRPRPPTSPKRERGEPILGGQGAPATQHTAGPEQG